MPWYLKPTNWLLIALGAAVAYFGTFYLIQRATIAQQKGVITGQAAQIAGLQGQVDDYKKNIAAAKKAQQAQQKIADDTARLLAEAKKITAACTLGGQDEKILSAYTYYFNSGGLRRDADGGATVRGEVLPETNTPHAAGSGWTMKNLAENYLIVIDYALQLERTVNCYETNTD